MLVNNGLAGEDEEVDNMIKHLDRTSAAYRMEISAKKTKLMTNNTEEEIDVNSQKLETVTSFKYVGAVVSGEGSRPQVLLGYDTMVFDVYAPVQSLNSQSSPHF